MATLATSIVAQLSPTSVFTSVGNTAITWATFTNYSGTSANLTVHIVPSGDSASNENIIIKNLVITEGDTHQLYAASEKILLSDGDEVQAFSNNATSINAVIGYTSI